jgi:hypothetical protein
MLIKMKNWVTEYLAHCKESHKGLKYAKKYWYVFAAILIGIFMLFKNMYKIATEGQKLRCKIENMKYRFVKK